MKTVYVEQTMDIPEDVKITVASRKVTVSGKYGELSREFKHLPLDATVEEGKLKVAMWNADNRMKACVRTFCSHVANMIKGVTKMFQYKMRLVYCHYPININITDNGNTVEIRNFLGQRRTRCVKLAPGVTCVKSTTVKDELVVSGIDIEGVSRSCALIRQNALVRNKDIRLFLDGIYVSEKGLVLQEA
ncbi:60S ribosomal protein L9 [Gregarina niphandrodes]|uniref:60S ribosomal protein L9 n=1 Tax=Gregarina niphandrodes TaxID=110365 RepID=A0A023B5V2_GRENI|nr:60S ribosomal protein L9 [Gregarina niphandrodes]EZG62787.1 60S ribosomal protein L9 [Gregarina niphandrodes]|eukprot:XP_011130708.1 60S ribosomal protein L9 [Gregarina niphandrodes]